MSLNCGKEGKEYCMGYISTHAQALYKQFATLLKRT